MFIINALESLFYFPEEYLPAALLISLLSVWVLVSLFFYLNYYTRKRYFSIWTVAWLFYALWLTLPLSMRDAPHSPFYTMIQQWSVSVAAVFLLWGSAVFMKLPAPQRLFGLFLCFLLAWSYIGAYHLKNLLQIQLPIFLLTGLGSVMAATSYFRLRLIQPRLLGAGLLAVGFFFLGLFLMSYPFWRQYDPYICSGYFMSAVLHLFIAVSMIILMLEEAQLTKENAEYEAQQARLEKELLRSQMEFVEDKYQRLFDQANEGIIIGAADTQKILKLNPMAASLLAINNNQTDLPISLFFQPEFAPPKTEDTQLIAKWMEWLGSQTQINLTGCQGKVVEVTGKASPIHFEGQVAIQFVFQDLSTQKRLETNYLRAQRINSIGSLTSGIAHDLNNILGPNLLSVQLLREKPLDASSASLVNSLESTTRRGINLIKQLLVYARGADGIKVRILPKHLFDEITDIVRATFPRNIVFELYISQQTKAIFGNFTQLHQVLMNLCLNSRDAMQQGGKLVLSAYNTPPSEILAVVPSCQEPREFVTFSVADSGIGIAPEHIDRIFDPFFSTKEPGEGTGLGLATALGIIKSHGGFIMVESKENQGSVFKVLIPTDQGPTYNQSQEISKSLPKGKMECVLIVDDEPFILQVIKESLESNNYEVISASNGQEALSCYAQQKDRIQAVLIDWIMPIMSGPELIEALKEINPLIKTITMSGMTAEEDKSHKKNPEIHLIKPFTTYELLSILADKLNNH